MALTDQQIADCRRWAGYPMLADTVVNDTYDWAYGSVYTGVFQTLNHRLTNMRPEEESILINTYLTALSALEAAIPASGDDLDTNVAAVWERNPKEVSDRVDLFDDWRRRMCGFIGVHPGPALGDGGMRIMRS